MRLAFLRTCCPNRTNEANRERWQLARRDSRTINILVLNKNAHFVPGTPASLNLRELSEGEIELLLEHMNEANRPYYSCCAERPTIAINSAQPFATEIAGYDWCIELDFTLNNGKIKQRALAVKQNENIIFLNEDQFLATLDKMDEGKLSAEFDRSPTPARNNS